MLIYAVSTAAYHSARPAARAPPHHGAGDTLSCRHRAVTACKPPVLDERQAAIMKAQGYQWDAERRRWYRGDPTRRVRAECRSGGRFIRFVDVDGETATGCSPAVTAAVERFATVVQTAREESVSVDREADLDFKNRLSSKLAPAAWLGLQAVTLGAAQVSLAPLWGTDVRAVAFGLAAAPALIWLRRLQTGVLPGVEVDDGALERLIADAALGNYALPATWEWRAESVAWRALAAAAEAVAAVNCALLLHAGLQSAVSRGAGAPWGEWAAVAAVAAVPTARAAFQSQKPLDGAPAELAAAHEAARNADTFFLMTSKTADGEQRVASAAEAAEALRALAAGWEEAFGCAASAQVRAPLLAGASGALLAAAWQLSGGSLAAPLAAQACVLVDAYTFLDREAGRASVPLAVLATRGAETGRE